MKKVVYVLPRQKSHLSKLVKRKFHFSEDHFAQLFFHYTFEFFFRVSVSSKTFHQTFIMDDGGIKLLHGDASISLHTWITLSHRIMKCHISQRGPFQNKQLEIIFFQRSLYEFQAKFMNREMNDETQNKNRFLCYGLNI